MTARPHAWFVALLFVGAAPGCGGAASFQPGFREYREPEFSEVVGAIQHDAPREERPVVVGITATTPARVFAWDLVAGRKLWERAVDDVTAAPFVAGDDVVTHEHDRVVLRSLATGDELTAIDARGAKLVGADGVHDLVAVTLSIGTDANPQGRLVAVRGASGLWARDVELPLGVPAVVGDMIIVPWGTLQVTVVDATTGRERARLRIRDDVVAQVFVDRGAVYFGQHGIFRITPSVQSGSKVHSAYFAPRARPLPGQPLFLRDGYEAAPAPDSAHHRVRVAWRPAGEGETITLEDDSLYYVFYKLLFSLAPSDDGFHWVFARGADIVGVQAQPGGALVADADGKLAFVAAASGAQTWEVDMGTGPLAAANVRAGAFVPPAPSSPVADPPPVVDRLFAAAHLDDARLGAGRALAVQYMARTDTADVTGHLVTLCSDRESPAQVRDAACDALANSTTGGEHVLDALALRQSFLDGTPAPPVGALARAAAKMTLRRAVPDLLALLADPATDAADLPPLLSALGGLHAVGAARGVEEFLRLYHADATDAHSVEAVGVAAETLQTLRGHGADAALHFVAEDPATPPALRDRLAHDLATGPPSAHADAPPPPASPPPTHAPPAHPPPPPETDARAAQLTGEVIAGVLHPIDRQLQRCVSDAEPAPPSARAVIVVDASGEVSRVSVSPPAVAPCVEHQIRTRRFPETRLGHPQQVTWVIRPVVATPPPAAHGAHPPADGGVPAPHARPHAPRDAGAPGSGASSPAR